MLDQPNHEIRQSEMAINDARIHCISMQFALFGFSVDRWTLQRTVLCCARLGFALAPVNFATPTAGRPLRQSRFRRFGGFTRASLSASHESVLHIQMDSRHVLPFWWDLFTGESIWVLLFSLHQRRCFSVLRPFDERPEPV